MADVVVYGKEDCHFCKEAKKLNKINGIKFVWKDVSDPDTRNELLSKHPTARTVPQIFVNGKHIGGYDQYREYVKNNLVGIGKLN